MFSKKKNLGQFLSELANSAPSELDPDQLEQNAFSYTKSFENLEEDDERATEHYLKINSSSIKKNIPTELDSNYRGKVISRKNLYQDDDDANSESDNSEEEELEVNSNNSENTAEESIEDFDSKSHLNNEQDSDLENGYESGDSKNMNVSSEENSESDFDEAASFNKDETEEEVSETENNEIEQELQKINQQERKLIKTISDSAKASTEKGMHLKNQMSIYDSVLDTRIKLQQMLAIGNRFPQYDNYTQIINPENSTLMESIKSASNELKCLIDELLELRMSVLKNNTQVAPQVMEKFPENLKKRKRLELDDAENIDETLKNFWTSMQGFDSSFLPFRDEVIEKWYNKIKSAGGGALLNKKFKAVDQSTLTQIRVTLMDHDRLIKRTRLKRSNYNVIGKERVQSSEEVPNPDEHLSNYDAEIFDDEDFYSILLKEFIESKMSDGTDDPMALSLKSIELKKLKKNKKKNLLIDQKASKGRKIRYQVHEKLENFMSSIPTLGWHNGMINELFSGLFGGNFKEESVKKKSKNSKVIENVENNDVANEVWKDLPQMKIFA
ncbi:hypothetical protein HK099_000398 [Clydaea vesicula]|uniref:Protein BFR2 n=1 Tax=Clydaea vesicula TaxID=447962 RepID=A0AAD5TUQ6_9FUNG|nr:hypothetical protein HK099_000398 [Clydaea vesicula]